MKDPKKEKRPISHNLYDRIGINFSLKAVDIFIAIVVIALIAVVVIGIVL